MVNGERVTALRMARGWSVHQLAIQAAMTRDGVYKIEAGGREKPRVDSIVAIAKALNTSTDYLLNLTDNPAQADHSEAVPMPTPDVIPMLQRLNALPAEQRTKVIAVVEATLALLD